MFVCTHILTVRTQVFLFKANYGTAVADWPVFLLLIVTPGQVDLLPFDYSDYVQSKVLAHTPAAHD